MIVIGSTRRSRWGGASPFLFLLAPLSLLAFVTGVVPGTPLVLRLFIVPLGALGFAASWSMIRRSFARDTLRLEVGRHQMRIVSTGTTASVKIVRREWVDHVVVRCQRTGVYSVVLEPYTTVYPDWGSRSTRQVRNIFRRQGWPAKLSSMCFDGRGVGLDPLPLEPPG